MDDLNRNTNEVIMQVNNLFRYADPVFRLTTIGTIKLIQFLARMAKEKRLSSIEAEDFVKFLKAADGKYDIMNIPAAEKGVLSEELGSLGIRYAILPDLRVGDGSIQFEIANSDMGKVSQWYKLKQHDMLHAGEDLPPMETISMEQYQQTGEMSEQDYMDTADKEMKRANEKYEGREKGEAETSALPERVVDASKSLAETVTIHLKQPAPPVLAR